ncbi:alanine dehydrogenase [Desulfosporosinus sp. PR]|uniref:alanine dehydrogenase n=1 Tax=Candidatus Desulfosporosinus nitrosoreducens TaxID=3401928 RepID=UPI0027F84901|nr:alanine dehydrogenase [Desulfosporosinus sp. PR]MDQ7095258.1 alanine dehydrogenase [Desulfosporosinus sp. PR]
MIVGLPKEIKNNENRVALTPAGAHALVHEGHKVIVETSAGVGSGFSDDEYITAGAEIISSAEKVFASADMIIKVKEPLPSEYDLLREGQILYTYLHLAPDMNQTKALLKNKVTGVAYETIQPEDGSLPLLTPMSEVAGRMSAMVGSQLLAKYNGGKGVLLCGVPGVAPAKVTIVGGGVVGTNAAKIALGMGADVTIMDINPKRLRMIDDMFGFRIKTVVSTSYSLAETIADTDLLIGAVLVPGAKAPKVVTEKMVASMRKGSAIVDVAIDQGGCVETIDHATTHDDPIFEKHGVVHYSVANMPGAFARTSTLSLTNVTLPYAIKLANKGIKAALEDPALAKGVNVINGHVTYEEVAKALGLAYVPLNEAL